MLTKWSGLVLVLILLATPAAAIDFTVTGASVTATYMEPTANADATPLTDLAKTNVYYQVPASTPVKGPDVAATRPQGGGVITTQVTVPVVAGQDMTVTFWATATDTAGNESARSTEVQRRIDRLAPAAPN